MHLELFVRYASVKVLIHLSHDFVDLALRDCEAKSLKKVLELSALYEPVLIRVNLVEHLIER